MASCSSTLSTTISHRQHHCLRRPNSDTPAKATKVLQLSPSSTSFLHHSLLALKLNSLPGRCRATSPVPPSQSEPPSDKFPQSSRGISVSFGRFKDTVQIFVAVLFWMSLFFWSSAWDGRNNDSPNKGSRFRK